MTQASFIQHLLEAVPEGRATVDEHLEDNDELLLHLLMADLLGLAVSAHSRSDHEVAQRLPGFVDQALREGDENVENAVCVSFVELIGAGAGETEGFIASWPAALLDEVNRQQAWRPEVHER